MEKIAMTNGSGQWFNKETAEKFNEGEHWDGSNNISMATGSQWNHEDLFRTASGKWVFHCWSQMQGSIETYEIIDDGFAAKWLITNGRESDIVKD